MATMNSILRYILLGDIFATQIAFKRLPGELYTLFTRTEAIEQQFGF